jgi:hypothetical protein
VPDDSGRKIMKQIATRLFPDQPDPQDTRINPSRAAEMIEMYNTTRCPHLDEDLCIRIFFMVLNSNFLTPNTYCYLRSVDVIWCQDIREIAGYN